MNNKRLLSLDYGLARTLIILGSVAALSPLSMDTYLTIAAHVAQSLTIDSMHLKDTITIVLFGNIAGLLLWGATADKLGARSSIMICLAIFSTSSSLCAIAEDYRMLMAGRFLQAFAVIGCRISAQTLVAQFSVGQDLAKRQATLGSISAIAVIISPLAGIALLQSFGWRGVFTTLALLGLMLLPLCLLTQLDSNAQVRPGIRSHPPLLGTFRTIATNRYAQIVTLVASLSSACFAVYVANAPEIGLTVFGLDTNKFGLFLAAQGVLLIVMRLLNRAALSFWKCKEVFSWMVGFQFTALLVSVALSSLAAPTWLVFVATLASLLVVPAINVNALALVQSSDPSSPGVLASAFALCSTTCGALVALCSNSISVTSNVPWWMFVCATIALITVLCARRSLEAGSL